MARLVACALVAATSALAVVAACGAFDSDPVAVSAPDGGSGPDASNADDAGVVADASDDALPPFEPACPAPAYASSCQPNQCNKRELYVPDAVEYPFAIATDERFVYWVAQRAVDGGNAYDGHSVATIRRVDRDDPSRVTVIADGELHTEVLVLDGEWVYWSARNPEDLTAADLRRAPRLCAGPSCKVETVKTLPSHDKARRLARAAPGVLVWHGGDTFVRRIDVGSSSVTVSPLPTTNYNPSLAVTSDRAFFGSGAGSQIYHADLSSGASGSLFVDLPRIDAGAQGAALLATDCETLFILRDDKSVSTSPVAEANLELWTTVNIDAPFDMVVDARYLYFAGANSGGVFALDKKSSSLFTIEYPANVFKVAVDSVGVYWGLHAGSGAGTIYMMAK